MLWATSATRLFIKTLKSIVEQSHSQLDQQIQPCVLDYGGKNYYLIAFGQTLALKKYRIRERHSLTIISRLCDQLSTVNHSDISIGPAGRICF